MPSDPQLPDGAPPAGASPTAPVAPRGARRGARRAPQWRMIFAMGLFAATVYAATNGVLRLAVEAPRDARGEVIRAPAPAPEPAPVPAPAPASSPPATPATTPAPAPASAPSEGAGAPPTAAAPGPATRDPAARDATSPEDTNEDESAAAGRRGAPPKASEDEAPEYRESADNNISLPVDI